MLSTSVLSYPRNLIQLILLPKVETAKAITSNLEIKFYMFFRLTSMKIEDAKITSSTFCYNEHHFSKSMIHFFFIRIASVSHRLFTKFMEGFFFQFSSQVSYGYLNENSLFNKLLMQKF